MSDYYFDYNATTPVLPEVLKAMEPYFTRHFGNPSSSHQPGQAAAKMLKDVRRKTAVFLGAAVESEIIFTSGGTESNNLALRSALSAAGSKKEIITSAVEHSSIRKLCYQLVKEGYTLREIGVDAEGQLKLEELYAALSENTALVTLMMANNETGVIFPVEEIGKELKKRGIFFHVDAVQAVGKLAIDLKNMSVDYLSVSAHKFYGPKGIGVLYARKGAPVYSLIAGGSQERGRRAGTENVPGIAGLGAAIDQLQLSMGAESARLKELKEMLEAEILRQIPDITITGQAVPRLVNTSHLRFRGVEAETILISLDQRGIYASSGSACMSGAQEPSHVLKAMGLSDEECNSAVRISMGRETTQASIHILISELKDIVGRLRAVNSGTGVLREPKRTQESLV